MRFVAFAAVVLFAGCASELEGASEETQSPLTAAGANPASPAVPAAWLALARAKPIVAVAGTNSARETTEALARGEGTAERPLHRVQAFEAAATLLERAGVAHPSIYAFGYGAAPTPGARYVYRALSGRELAVVYLGRRSVSPGESPGLFSFGTGQARADAEALRDELADDALADALLVGHSWGGAVIDYGQQLGVLDAPGISIGAPAKLLSSPFHGARLRDEGDVPGELYVARRPDDPIGDENIASAIRAFLDPKLLARHDYMMVGGGTWGLSESGTLCSAAYGGGCPAP